MPFDAEPIEKRIATGLAKLGLAIKAQSWRGAEAASLTPTQGQALAVLAARGAGLGVGALAEALGVRQPTASDALAALVAKGLVRKTRRRDDGRAVALALTPAGRRAAKASAAWPDFLLKAVGALAADERRVLMAALVKMIRALQVAGEIPVARLCVDCTHFRPRVHADPLRPHHCAFVDAAFGDGSLRLDCADHTRASEADAAIAWRRFSLAPVATKENLP